MSTGKGVGSALFDDANQMHCRLTASNRLGHDGGIIVTPDLHRHIVRTGRLQHLRLGAFATYQRA